MKIYVQWTTATPQDWTMIDLASNRQGWRQLAKKPRPVGGEVIDNTPGWIAAVNVQGVIFSGFDNYGGEFVNPGGLRVYGWNDDPDDYDPSEFEAHVWTFLPLAPDPRFGGELNTQQSRVIYAAPASYALIEAQMPIENTTLRPYSEFVPPAAQITKYGIWMSDDLLRQHHERRTMHDWREWGPA